MKIAKPAAKAAASRPSLASRPELMRMVSPSDDRIVVTSKMFSAATQLATHNFKRPLSGQAARQALDAVKGRLVSDRDILDLGGTVGNLLGARNDTLVSAGGRKVLNAFLKTVVQAAVDRLPKAPATPPDAFSGIDEG